MHNIRVFSQRSAWAPYMRLHELRSFTHLGVTGPQKWPLSLKKGKSGRQKIKSWYFYCPYVFLKCLQCTFWRNQTVSFSGLSSSLTEAIFRSHMRCATPYWTWRQSQRTEELKSRTRPRTSVTVVHREEVGNPPDYFQKTFAEYEQGFQSNGGNISS